MRLIMMQKRWEARKGRSKKMTKVIKARFFNGVIEPSEEIELPEDIEISININDKAAVENEEFGSDWKSIARKISSQGYLTGKSEEVNKYVKEFRDSFSF
ncbi:Uncharacterized protein MCHI_000384 [Candidatus Magnetoovum chiemensis]|nr:Uncharacterized protein MCHI_000384 [Candidatus Magnetoovum chiemensis]